MVVSLVFLEMNMSDTTESFRRIRYCLIYNIISIMLLVAMIVIMFNHNRAMRDLLEERIEATEDVVFEMMNDECDGTCVPSCLNVDGV